jgi:molybdopterin molybdotransferase
MTAALPTYAQAAAVVAARAAELLRPRGQVERVALALAAGRILAEPLRADRDQPSFPRATRDGFACRATEASSHMPLAIAGATRAGQVPAGPLPLNSAWEIMTGGPVPEGADAIAMIEHVQVTGSSVKLNAPRTLEPGENIVPQGAEARAGDELVPIGTRLAPAHIALAATCGYATVAVMPRPRVAILTTGDELVSVDANPAPGQIRNSNAPMLAALVAAAGGEPWILPAATDDSASLDAALAESATADLLLISGGVSAGKFDLVEPALARIGARFHFTGVRIQPGKPLVFGELPRKSQPSSTSASQQTLPFFGLPGNPISSAATFLLFSASILAALAGSTEQTPRFALATAARNVKGKPDLTRFIPAFCDFNPPNDKPPTVAPVGSQGSGDLAAFARSNCFLVVPEGVVRLEAGSLVRILLV